MRDTALASDGQWWRRAPVERLDASTCGGSRLPYVALLSFPFVLMAAPQIWFPSLAPLRLALLAAAAAAAFHVLDRFAHRESIITPTRELTIVGCLVGWAVVTI